MQHVGYSTSVDKTTRKRQPCQHANIVDKTGAGDFFAGGYLFGLQKGLTLTESAEIANKSAAHVISEIGVRPKNKFD